ncbi:hypothetical protein [Palaeococcus ferrophilus]|uniref:hypothetical protein n=1 Tax=Palaeococcus ferrophilus TaxID=83868 RepID=UPI00064E66CC|nr:hypothetical protein [Palaeococcus ferrophilus]
MRLKPVVFSVFLLLSIYFLGIGVLSYGERFTFAGYIVVALMHLAVGVGILRNSNALRQLGSYFLLLDFLFGLLWTLIGERTALVIMFVSALALVLVTSDELRKEMY